MLNSQASDGGKIDDDFKRRLRKLKPSGVQFSLYIAPDQSEDDDNNPIAKMRKKEEVKQIFGKGESKIDVNQKALFEEQKKKEKEEAKR